MRQVEFHRSRVLFLNLMLTVGKVRNFSEYN